MSEWNHFLTPPPLVWPLVLRLMRQDVIWPWDLCNSSANTITTIAFVKKQKASKHTHLKFAWKKQCRTNKPYVHWEKETQTTFVFRVRDDVSKLPDFRDPARCITLRCLCSQGSWRFVRSQIWTLMWPVTFSPPKDPLCTDCSRISDLPLCPRAFFTTTG